MTTLYYAAVRQRIPEALFSEKLGLLPAVQREKINRLRRWQDAQGSLLGQLLLGRGLSASGQPARLDEQQVTRYGKPFIECCPLCFNISHAGCHVVCVVSDDTSAIGVDIEEIRTIDQDSFRDIWTVREWEYLRYADPALFYRYWTRKEAIIKADGRGLSIPLPDVDVHRNPGMLGDVPYFLEEPGCRPGIVISLASQRPISPLRIEEVQHFELF